MGKAKKHVTEAGADQAPASTDESAVASWVKRGEAKAIQATGACFGFLQNLRRDLNRRAAGALGRGDQLAESALTNAEKATLRAIEKLRAAGLGAGKPGEVLQAA